MKRVQRLLAWAFGAIFVALSVVVSVETLTRKVFNYSIQGADELGGYALAAGSVIAFSLALIGRNHIRVDVFHEHFSRRMQAWLNALSYLLLAVFAVLLAVVAFKVVTDTLAYRSTAPTPWQTPLIWPTAQYSLMGDPGRFGQYWSFDTNVLQLTRSATPTRGGRRSENRARRGRRRTWRPRCSGARPSRCGRRRAVR